MKKFFLAAVWIAAAAVIAGENAPAPKPFLSATVDFLDMCFYDRIGEKDFYSLESYERRIRELAEVGIKRLNLRTNVLGLTFYKSRYTLQYGEREMWHYTDPSGSRRLIETLKRYDPLTETIRLGHKYGMDVWAWENISDESGGGKLDRKAIAPEALPLFEKNGSRPPLIDPFFTAHPECWASRKPADFEHVANSTIAARRWPVARIVLKSYRNDPPKSRAVKEDFALFYSFDNKTYKRYEKDFDFKVTRDADNYNCFEFSGLDIRAPYIKLASSGNRYPNDRGYTFSVAVVGQKSAGEVYNSRGEKIDVSWGCHLPVVRGVAYADGYQLDTPLQLEQMVSMGVDYGQYQIGFYVGEVFGNERLVGLVEFCNDVAMKHKLDRFSELAAYPFDGFRMSLNCHSHASDPDEFSYNAALRQRLLDKTGKDIWRDELPIERILEERAAGFSEYLEGCKKLIGNRPMYLYGWPPGGTEHGMLEQGRSNMGHIRIDYPRLIKNGTIDGVAMYYDFHDYFTNEVTGGRRIDLSYYNCVEIRGSRKLDALPAIARIPGLTEIDLYGAVVLTNPAHREKIRKFVESQAK